MLMPACCARLIRRHADTPCCLIGLRELPASASDGCRDTTVNIGMQQHVGIRRRRYAAISSVYVILLYVINNRNAALYTLPYRHCIADYFFFDFA